MDRFLHFFCALGTKHDIQVTAPTQQVLVGTIGQDNGHSEEDGKDALAAIAAINDNTYTVAPKPLLLDRWLDNLVEWSGNQFVFFFILCGLITWAFLGIIFSHFTDWQVGISDGQAIINLVFDSFLMRQQLNSHERTRDVLGVLKSRAFSTKRMLRKLVQDERQRMTEEKGEKEDLPTMSPGIVVQLETEEQEEATKNELPEALQLQQPQQQPAEEEEEHQEFAAEAAELPLENLSHQEFAVELPPENLFGRICTTISNITGHIVTVSFFWVGIFIWLSFGPRDHWSSTWLLYINSASSALMVFVLAFLANIRERHGEYANRCLEAIWKVDATLELKLRTATGDAEPNPTVTIAAPRVNRIERVIDYYGDLVGALVGIAILILTMVVWFAIGPAMHFDSNWWLLIGTYAGLVGMNDGFVLRNVFYRLHGYEDGLFEEVGLGDEDALSILAALDCAEQGLEPDLATEQAVLEKNLTERISLRMGQICSHEYAVVLGGVTIVGLIIGASAMRWSLVGQLLCNVPPSIIESFFMMILITGHNLGERRRRMDLAGAYERRLRLLREVEGVVGRKTG